MGEGAQGEAGKKVKKVARWRAGFRTADGTAAAKLVEREGGEGRKGEGRAKL